VQRENRVPVPRLVLVIALAANLIANTIKLMMLTCTKSLSCQSAHLSFAFKRLLLNSSCTAGRCESVTQQEHCGSGLCQPLARYVGRLLHHHHSYRFQLPKHICLGVFRASQKVIIYFSISHPISAISPTHHARNRPTDDQHRQSERLAHTECQRAHLSPALVSFTRSAVLPRLTR